MSITRATRKRTATIIEHKPGARGGSVEYRFPMPDKAHARNALARLPVAHDLTAQEKRLIAQRAANVLEEVTPEARLFGVRRVTKSTYAAEHQRPLRRGFRSRRSRR
jgi:hypothetical protein